MKRYIEPTIEIFDLKARGLMEKIGVHGSTGVDQDPSHNGSGSGSFGARPHTIEGGHMEYTRSAWDK